MSNYTDGYLQACRDIKVEVNERFSFRTFAGMVVSRSEVNDSIVRLVKIEKKRNA